MCIFEIVIIAIMLGFNSIFAAFELALASISAGRLRMLADQKVGGAVAARYITSAGKQWIVAGGATLALRRAHVRATPETSRASAHPHKFG